MVLLCHLSSYDYVFDATHYFMGGVALLYVTTLPRLDAIDVVTVEI